MTLESLAVATIPRLVEIILEAIRSRNLQRAEDATEALGRRIAFEELQRTKTPKKKTKKKKP